MWSLRQLTGKWGRQTEGERMCMMAQDENETKSELTGEITSNDTLPETKEPTLAEKVETVEISSMKPSKTEYTK